MVGQPNLGPLRPDVFISYKHADEPHARRLLAVLESAGYEVWWDGMIEAGSEFAKSTEVALENARAVLVVWSANSIDSHWVRDEAQFGREHNRLVPVSIDGTLPPLGFRQIQSPDLSNWDGKTLTPEIEGVLDAIRNLVGTDSTPSDSAPSYFYRTEAHAAKKARPALVAIVVAAITLIASLGWWWGGGADSAEANSIAILPFDNLNQDPDQAYFSTGLSEEMRQVFSQNVDLLVAAQTSSDVAARSNQSAEQISESLGVRYLLDGSVRRAGAMVRVSVQLIDGTTGFDVWSETYDRSLDDIFAVQTEIAGQVYQALQLRMAQNGGASLRKGGTTNAVAYDAYLRGKSLYALAVDEDSDRAALRAFETAIEADPNYGAAWAALSRAQTVVANSYASDGSLSEAYGTAVASARKAVEVAPDLADSHAALGFVLLNGRLDAAAAEGPFNEAYRLGGGDAEILQLYATYAARVGEYDAARNAIVRSIKLDPLNAVAYRAQALIEYSAGEFGAARGSAAKALEINPDISVAHRVMGYVALFEGDYRKALELFGRERSNLSKLPGIAIASHKLGNEADSDAAFTQLREEFGDNGLYQQAQILAMTGRPTEALNALERAYAANDSGLVLMRGDPMFESLHKQPRFLSLLQRMGFQAP